MRQYQGDLEKLELAGLCIQLQQPDYTMILYGILGAVVIAIIIGLVAVALVLRKRS
jgi:hypothetical protein